MEAVQEFISITPWTVVFSICNLLILCVLLKKFLFKPVMKVLEDRQKEIDGTYVAAQNERKQAENLQKEYVERMRNARAEADEIVRSANQTAQKRSDAILAETEAQVSHLKRKAAGEIEQEKRKAYSELQSEIAGMAVEIASKVVGREITERDQQDLVDDFIRNVGDGK